MASEDGNTVIMYVKTAGTGMVMHGLVIYNPLLMASNWSKMPSRKCPLQNSTGFGNKSKGVYYQDVNRAS